MSHMSQSFLAFLRAHPEVEKCSALGLINRRSLARHLIDRGVADAKQLDAVIAMLRRHEFSCSEVDEKDGLLLDKARLQMKDRILILDFEKERALLEKLEGVISTTRYEKGDTLKLVVGTGSIKLFIDQEKEKTLASITRSFSPLHREDDITEISLQFPEDARVSKGILAGITRELAINDIVINEFLTATPELLLYVKKEYVLKTYEVLRRMQQ
ncbi:MAG: hypothetical protein ABIC95_04050 [archaeon]